MSQLYSDLTKPAIYEVKGINVTTVKTKVADLFAADKKCLVLISAYHMYTYAIPVSLILTATAPAYQTIASERIAESNVIGVTGLFYLQPSQKIEAYATADRVAVNNLYYNIIVFTA